MRIMFFIITMILCSAACNYNRVEVIKQEPAVPGVDIGVPWDEFVFLVTVPLYDYGTEEETTDIFVGLRFDANRILTKKPYLHEPRKELLSIRGVHEAEGVKASIITPYFGFDFSALEAEVVPSGKLPIFQKRHPRLGEDLSVGPYRARVYSSRLHGERFRRYTIVTSRDIHERSDIPDPCTPGLPLMDKDDFVIGIALDFHSSAYTFPPIGFDQGRCEIITIEELFDRYDLPDM